MKKFTTKLLMSIIAVAFAFVALGTSTYAWFAMNQNVTVTGMQLSAKSDSTFLIIGETENVATLQGNNAVTVAKNISAADSKVYPAAHGTIGTTSAAEAKNDDTDPKYTNWFYQVADSPTASTSSTSEVLLAASKFNQYVIHETVYVVLAKGSNPATNLVASLTAFASNNTATGDGTHDNSAVKVLITSTEGAVELDGTTTSDNSKVLAANITDQTAIKLDIYLYYDGNNGKVYTNNALNLDGATFTINFTVTPGQGQ